jgi:hypothetical protein
VSWAEFREAFREHHIPDGLMDRKQQEFLHLKQGFGTVYEYCKRFIYLVQYGAHHVGTDVKKITLFHKGLCAKIHEQLMPFQSWTFNQHMSGKLWTQSRKQRLENCEEEHHVTQQHIGISQIRWHTNQKTNNTNTMRKTNFSIEIQQDYFQSTEVTALHPYFDYWNKNLFLAHSLISRKMEMKLAEVTRSLIPLGSYL